MEIHTILGSCVAVCIYDTLSNKGGMNHFMLPFWNGRGLASPKYGNIALQRLIEQMLSIGSKKTNLVAKVFGGGNVLETLGMNQNMGDKNISVAFQMLEEYGVQVAANSTGGELGRKIIFETHTGKVRQRYVNRLKLREMPIPEMRKK
ncbi:MAG: chemotaxis protein CheD [Bacteroidales bacterium]|nr:chemotaxis protein CheD [Bacteroidales bacterium]MCF8338725.1 chemotaxis protein CheD [Bacteroidales bacterium]